MIRKRTKSKKEARIETLQNEYYMAGFKDGLRIAAFAVGAVLVVIIGCYYMSQ